MSKHINKGIGRTHYDGDDCCPKPQANTVDEIERMFDGHTYEVEIDGKTMTVVALYSAVNITKNKIQALTTAARVEQIMQDELSLMDTELPEEEIIQWRLDRLTQLKEKL